MASPDELLARRIASRQHVAIPEAHDARVRRVLKIIESDVSLSMHELASAISLSVAHMERLFKQETGMHMRDLLSELRMQKAAELLATSYLEVKEIAYAVGYRHHSSFDRAFQRRFAETPKTHRQKTAA